MNSIHQRRSDTSVSRISIGRMTKLVTNHSGKLKSPQNLLKISGVQRLKY